MRFKQQKEKSYRKSFTQVAQLKGLVGAAGGPASSRESSPHMRERGAAANKTNPSNRSTFPITFMRRNRTKWVIRLPTNRFCVARVQVGFLGIPTGVESRGR